MRPRVLLAAFLVAAPAIAAAPAPPPPPPPANAASLAPDDLKREIILRSPAGQYLVGVRREGIYDIADQKVCSRWAIATLLDRFREPPPVQLIGNKDAILDREAPKGVLSRPLNPRDLGSSIRSDLDRALKLLRLAGDKDVVGRHVCVGLASYAQANAESLGAGFMLFDPQLYYNLNRYKGRSMRTGQAIVLHEFAHQLQFWTEEPVLADKKADGEAYARRGELQADCVASALVTASAVELKTPYIWKVTRPGVRTAFRELGDFNLWSKGHHGLLNERDLAAEYGIRLVEKRAAAPQPIAFPARWALDECRAMLERMDKKYGNPWPITAALD